MLAIINKTNLIQRKNNLLYDCLIIYYHFRSFTSRFIFLIYILYIDAVSVSIIISYSAF